MAQSHIIPLSLLRPTQMTVGLLQVKHKRERIRALAKRPAELIDFILEHPIRVVRGPAERAYVIDHHHFALALIKEKYQTAPMEVDADFSNCKMKEFWKKMQSHHFVHTYDAHGMSEPLRALPTALEDLKDDPFRSLAGFVRMEGGFTKVETPFAEFAWADFYRLHFRKKDINRHFKRTLKEAVLLAKSKEAKHLPGYLSK